MRVRVRAVAAGALLVLAGTAAWAQENLEQGKSGAQLFATDCAICHKSPQTLVKDGYPTEGFLRVHYASSREMAAAVSAYLRGIARPEAGEARTKRGKHAEGGKPAANKKSGAKAGEANAPEKGSEKKD
jgi:cytochrome c553